MASKTTSAKLQKLLDFISGSSYKTAYSTAKATGTCMMCGKPARVFRDASARLEYDVSALCQTCQDDFFKEK